SSCSSSSLSPDRD
ncbi:unnamed protein product, partial [Rotaria sordida]